MTYEERVEAAENEIVAVLEKYNLVLIHEDEHGEFLFCEAGMVADYDSHIAAKRLPNNS